MLLEADRAELARPLSIDGLFDAPKPESTEEERASSCG